MNDFTKDELDDLYEAMRHCYKQCIDLPSDTDTERFSYDLMTKIQSMIDNYCDHNWNELQWNTIRKIQSMLHDCHYIDIVIRHNGKDKWFEGDFLKQLMRNK